MNSPPLYGRHLTLVLLSTALLAYQIALLQVLATSQWHHFAYLVISVALLGFGAAGTVLSLYRQQILASQNWLLPLLLCLCAIMLAASLGMINLLVGGFDSYLIFTSLDQALRLAATALIVMLGFLCGAMAINIIFVSHAERIGSYYFANMLGSGLGCALALAGLGTLPPPQLPPICALLALLSAAPHLARANHTIKNCAAVTLLITLACLFRPPELTMSEYKDLSRTLNLPGATVVKELPSTFGLLQVVKADVLRSAPGLSLNWHGVLPKTSAIFVNGNMVGSLPSIESAESPRSATTTALPYAFSTPRQMLVLDAGTGQDIPLALENGVERITAVESNRTLVRQLRQMTGRETGLFADRVTWHTVASRTWLARNTHQFDLVILPQIGNFGGSAGLFALHEQPLLTREALHEAWRTLTPNGVLSITTWIDYPVRAPIRLMNSLVEMLNKTGVEPAVHIAALRSWGTLTFCVKKSPYSANELARIRAFADRWAFDPLLLPDLEAAERTRYNKLQDNSLLQLIDATFNNEQRHRLYRDYLFRVYPVDDDQPFFSQFLRWSRLDSLHEQIGQRSVPFLELGLFVAGLSALVLTLMATLLILLPLARLRGEPGSRLRTFCYFGGLGVGYMWFELAMIHRFESYLGQPVYSASLVIAVLLIGSACGSALSTRISEQRAQRASMLVCLVLCGYALGIASLLDATLALSLTARAAVAMSALVPVAFLMGFPFPLGLRALNRQHAAELPWALGINGCLSVFGAAVATLAAVEVGYSALLLLAALAYLLPGLSGITITTRN